MASARLLRLARYVVPAGSSAKIAERLFRRGTAARNAGHHLSAAILYEEAIAFTPGIGRMHVQAGHMFKEAGDFEKAEEHYRAADRLMPGNADLALQFGHFHKLAGRPDLAVDAYRRALELQPGWQEATLELARIDGGAARADRADERAALARGGVDGRWLVPELLPSAGRETMRAIVRDGLHVRQVGGRRERSRWGMMKTLRGLEAVRGFCVSAVPIRSIEVRADDIVLHTGPLAGLPLAGADDPRRKYVFNLWLDLSAVPPGRYEIEIRCLDIKGRLHLHRQTVAVDVPQDEACHPTSDGLVGIDPADPRPPEQQALERASMVRPATRSLLPRLPERVLVQRVDQLGDLVVSIPAIRRLRALLPDARIVGLLSRANADFGRTLALFDDVVVVDFPEDLRDGRRVMDYDAQEALRQALAPHRLDLAIDLSESSGSRPLLLLSGAPFLYGFRTPEAPWLSADVNGNSRDPIDGLENASHASKLVGMIDWLGGLLRPHGTVVARPGLDRDHLRRLGIDPATRFAVLHSGARLAFSRWPHFLALAERLLARTDLSVVLLGDDPIDDADLPPALVGDPRLVRIEGRMDFEGFDTLLSSCAVLVGNDSGPKHLAAVRGTPVVSLHMPRLNWNEWGQEGGGTIISRRVPCAGCGIHSAPEECGRDFTCIRAIAVEEVFDAVMALL